MRPVISCKVKAHIAFIKQYNSKASANTGCLTVTAFLCSTSSSSATFCFYTYHHCPRAKGSSTEDQGEAGIGQSTLSSPICSFICQDQLLVLAVLLSCPLERGGSQLERGARGYALSPLCGETHGGLERLSAGAERKSEREHTWGGWFFFLTKVRLVFWGAFLVQGHLLSGGQIYWRYTILEGGKGPSASSLTDRDIWL